MSVYNILFSLFLCVNIIHLTFSFNFDTSKVQMISADDLKDSYFGYALLLQKGPSPSVIVGAPKQNSTHRRGGSLYKCDIRQNKCRKLQLNKYDDSHGVVGNWLGSVVDGDVNGRMIFTCSPRSINDTKSQNYYLKGVCYEIDQNEKVKSIVPLEEEDPTDVYGYTFYYAGFGQAGIDIEYLQDSNELILGAPGLVQWNGALIKLPTPYDEDYDILPDRKAPTPTEKFAYLGYKVTGGKFAKHYSEIWYVAGSPRGSDLNGKVVVFKSFPQNALKIKVIASFSGEEMGSYFGSSLLIEDLNGDGYKDLVVGAPMGSGKTWDEGYVYYYKMKKTNDNFDYKYKKIYGSKSAGARFGTAMSNLGDIDHDSFNDIAISAPYENDGVGAVYIYKGSKEGLSDIISQKIVPSELNIRLPVNIRGFGLGLSKGNDIDNNGFNDLAIGAYKSDQVILLKTKSIVDYKVWISSNTKALKIDTPQFDFTYCVSFTRRVRSTSAYQSLQFQCQLLLDKRSNVNGKINQTFMTHESAANCNNATVSLIKTIKDISPFKISVKCSINQNDVIGIGEVNELSIPFSHGCGPDNICQTNLKVEAKLKNTPNIIVGLTNEIDVEIIVQNTGEPAYQCELYINVPKGIEFRNIRKCYLKNNTHVCPVDNRLVNLKTLTYKFDVKSISPDLKNLRIEFSVKSLGTNSTPAKPFILNTLVSLLNSPYIEGQSSPENYEYKMISADLNNNVEVTHMFLVGNNGPSPVKLDIVILVPRVEMDNIQIFEQIETKGSLNSIENFCYSSNNTNTMRIQNDLTPNLNVPENKTLRVDCLEDNIECMEIFCNGTYLYKLSGNAIYTVKLLIKTDLLAIKFQEQTSNKSILAFSSTAILMNETNILTGHSTTLIFMSTKQPLPIWIYILSSIFGLLLLILLIIILYKCHFFERNYRDRLQEEKILDMEHEEEHNQNEENNYPEIYT